MFFNEIDYYKLVILFYNYQALIGMLKNNFTNL